MLSHGLLNIFYCVQQYYIIIYFFLLLMVVIIFKNIIRIIYTFHTILYCSKLTKSSSQKWPLILCM